MNKFFILKLYITAVISCILCDVVWLGFVAMGYYKEQIGYLLAPSPNLLAAIAFYLLFAAGLLYFVVLPSLKVKHVPLHKVLLSAAFFGMVTYGTYDVTSLATVKNWPFVFTFIDTGWGMTASTVATFITFTLGKHIKK